MSSRLQAAAEASAIDTEMQMLVSHLACACVEASCLCLPRPAAELLWRVEIGSEAPEAAGAALGLEPAQARELLTMARRVTAETLVHGLSAGSAHDRAPAHCCCTGAKKPTRIV